MVAVTAQVKPFHADVVPVGSRYRIGRQNGDEILLTISRKVGEAVHIGEGIRVVVREIKGNVIRMGIEAPDDMPIYRDEVYQRIREENAHAARSELKDPSLVERMLNTRQPFGSGPLKKPKSET